MMTFSGGSLAYRTELALRRHEGSEVQAGRWPGVTVIRTPALPGFWWGNFLLMPRAPQPGDAPEWLARFVQVFPEAGHRAFGVDTADGAVGNAAPFMALGFEVIRYSVLTCAATCAHHRLDTAHDLRPLTTDPDWRAFTAFQTEMEAADRNAPGVPA